MIRLSATFVGDVAMTDSQSEKVDELKRAHIRLLDNIEQAVKVAKLLSESETTWDTPFSLHGGLKVSVSYDTGTS